MKRFPPIDSRSPIVDAQGRPTPPFILLVNQLLKQILSDAVDDTATAEQRIAALEARQIIAGFGLDGGGTLSSDVTLDLAARLDDLQDVDLSVAPLANQVLGWDAAENEWRAVNQAGGGGSAAWKILDVNGAPISAGRSVTITTPRASVDFVNLAQYSELMLIGTDVTGSVNSFRAVLASVDNGATFYSGAADYRRFTAAGATSNAQQYDCVSASSAGALGFWLNLLNSNAPGVTKESTGSAFLNTRFTASPLPINAIRYYHSSGGNITGGTLTLLGR